MRLISTNIARKSPLRNMAPGSTIRISFYLLPTGLLHNCNTKAQIWNNKRNSKSPNKSGLKHRASGARREWKIWRISRRRTQITIKSNSKVEMRGPIRNFTISMCSTVRMKNYSHLTKLNWNRINRLLKVPKTWCCRLLMNQGLFKCHRWIETDPPKKSSWC